MARGELHDEGSDGDADDRTELDDNLAAMGLELVGPQVPGCEAFYLWPQNLPAFNLWLALQTQWRYGFACATGLDYAGVAIVMQLHRVRRCRRREMWLSLQAMERAALEVWSQKAKANQQGNKQ
jgi:hypothetical protein